MEGSLRIGFILSPRRLERLRREWQQQRRRSQPQRPRVREVIACRGSRLDLSPFPTLRFYMLEIRSKRIPRATVFKTPLSLARSHIRISHLPSSKVTSVTIHPTSHIPHAGNNCHDSLSHDHRSEFPQQTISESPHKPKAALPINSSSPTFTCTPQKKIHFFMESRNLVPYQ
jgi:hypothetical protein